MENTVAREKFQISSLLFAAFLTAISAVAYELLLAGYATFLMGASVFQYALVFSAMMASMGVGAFFSQSVKNTYSVFFVIELILALLSVVAIPSLYLLFWKGAGGTVLLLIYVFLIGGGIGMEIPLINRILQEEKKLPEILFFDYLGGFLGGILFPLWLLPQLGFYRSASVMSLMNSGVALLFLFTFKDRLPKNKALFFAALGLALVGVAYFWQGENLRLHLEESLFGIRH